MWPATGRRCGRWAALSPRAAALLLCWATRRPHARVTARESQRRPLQVRSQNPSCRGKAPGREDATSGDRGVQRVVGHWRTSRAGVAASWPHRTRPPHCPLTAPGLRCLHRGLRELEAAAEPVRPAAVSACCFWEKSPTGDALRPGTTPGPGSPELASSSPSGSRQPAPPSALYSASDAWPVPRLPHTERRRRERHVLIANHRPGKRVRRLLARGERCPRRRRSTDSGPWTRPRVRSSAERPRRHSRCGEAARHGTCPRGRPAVCGSAAQRAWTQARADAPTERNAALKRGWNRGAAQAPTTARPEVRPVFRLL